jgi:hypothetical protein
VHLGHPVSGQPAPGEGDWHGPLPELPPKWAGERAAPAEPVGCPDGGWCHHECALGACFRVHYCGPLSGVYPGDEWPAEVVSAWVAGGVV